MSLIHSGLVESVRIGLLIGGCKVDDMNIELLNQSCSQNWYLPVVHQNVWSPDCWWRNSNVFHVLILGFIPSEIVVSPFLNIELCIRSILERISLHILTEIFLLSLCNVCPDMTKKMIYRYNLTVVLAGCNR